MITISRAHPQMLVPKEVGGGLGNGLVGAGVHLWVNQLWTERTRV